MQAEALHRKAEEEEEEVEELLRFDDEEERSYSSSDELDRLVAQSVSRYFSRVQTPKIR
jgi:hypothetical protein